MLRLLDGQRQHHLPGRVLPDHLRPLQVRTCFYFALEPQSYIQVLTSHASKLEKYHQELLRSNRNIAIPRPTI